jgi:hypothetical protein
VEGEEGEKGGGEGASNPISLGNREHSSHPIAIGRSLCFIFVDPIF